VGKVFGSSTWFLANNGQLRRKSPPPGVRSGVLCRSSVGRSDLDVVAKFTKLFREGFGTIDEELWFGFDALLNVADSLIKKSSRPSGIGDVRWPRQRTDNPDAGADAGTLPESGCLCSGQQHERPG